jgi:hypothetical protein
MAVTGQFGAAAKEGLLFMSLVAVAEQTPVLAWYPIDS